MKKSKETPTVAQTSTHNTPMGTQGITMFILQQCRVHERYVLDKEDYSILHRMFQYAHENCRNCVNKERKYDFRK